MVQRKLCLLSSERSKDVRGFEAPFAPLNEQKRIADNLDAVLARVDACGDRLDRTPTILKHFDNRFFRRHIGRTDEDWRDTKGLVEPWVNVRLGDIADVHGGVTKDSKKQSLADEEIPYLRVANVQRGFLDFPRSRLFVYLRAS